jgi:glycine cleavage system transcriptional repressor
MKTRFPTSFVLSVLAEDRPGIIAAVTKAVAAFDGNIDTCSQTLLGEYFTLIMIVSFPHPIEHERLEQEIADPHTGPGFQVLIRPYKGEQLAPAVLEGGSFVLTAFGQDRPGVVLRFAAFLMDKGINITDLYAATEDGQFVLVAQLRVPRQWDIRMLQTDLEHLAKEIGHTVRLQHEDVFVATNQLRLPHARTKAAMGIHAR